MTENVSQEQFGKVLHSLESTFSVASELATEHEVSSVEEATLNQKVLEMEHAIADYITVTEKSILNQQETIQHYKEIVDTGKLLGGLMTVS